MLSHPVLAKLYELRLHGMAKAYEEQLKTEDITRLTFDDRLGLMVDREDAERATRSLRRRLQVAKLRFPQACMEDVDLRTRRGLDRRTFTGLGSCEWVERHRNVLITGPTGVGKTWLACALGQKACREGFSTRYLRLPRLFGQLSIAHGDGTYPKLLASIARTRLLILDDWGIGTLDDRQRRDLLEILEDRYERCSTMVTSQLPVDKWHDVVADPTLADAILDRLVHNAYRLDLAGESMRKRQPPENRKDQ
jgi:DNA replication protein DnaC